MKTIKDAYEELKGDLKNTAMYEGSELFVFYDVSKCRFGTSYEAHPDFHEDEQHYNVGSTKEFNNYKGDDVKAIDWSEAPEWAIELGTDSGVMHYWMDDVSYQLTLHDKTSRVFFSNYDSKNKSSFIVIASRPQVKPVYTQAMCDAGEWPSVGMEYLCGDGQLNRCIDNLHGKAIGLMLEHAPVNGVLPLSQTSIGDCKPLTPPIELIDGKAYQFDARSTGRMVQAIYRNNKFHIGNGQYFDVESADDIKPLTVEG